MINGVNHPFKHSNYNYGYYAEIKDGLLTIGEERGREGGNLYSGGFIKAKNILNHVRKENPKLVDEIEEYYSTRQILQYTIEYAYDDNSRITKYVNGRLIDFDIISDCNIPGYCRALESEGYKKAYNVTEYEEKLKEAKEAYDEAVRALDYARSHALLKEE